VPDGVEFNESLVHSLAEGDLPPNISYLVGTNLDEGTEFLYATPELSCNATDQELRSWASTVFNDTSITEGIVENYANISLPVPQCEGGEISFPTTHNFIATSRAIGDSTFTCFVRALANRITSSPVTAENNYTFYNYFWKVLSMGQKCLSYLVFRKNLWVRRRKTWRYQWGVIGRILPTVVTQTLGHVTTRKWHQSYGIRIS